MQSGNKLIYIRSGQGETMSMHGFSSWILKAVSNCLLMFISMIFTAADHPPGNKLLEFN